MNKSAIFAVVIVLLIAGNLYTLSRVLSLQKDLVATQAIANERTVNDKILSFDRLFIQKVLNAKGEVSFEDRLQLENTVRDLNDPEILTAWNSFVNAKTQVAAQDAVRLLLSILAGKIQM